MFAFRTVCFWPGLPAAWVLGLTRGLWIALVFAWSVGLLLLATFVWPQWIETGLLRCLWALAWSVWLVTSVRNHWQWPRLQQTVDTESGQAFVEAQAEYLRGNWFNAEALLLEVLQRQPRDAEALLLLVGVLRHTKRWQPALRRLAQLELLDSAAPWRFEMAREKMFLQRGLAEQSASIEQDASPGHEGLPEREESPTEDKSSKPAEVAA